MRVTGEAKHQLQDILMSIGFPEESMQPVHMETIGEDPHLDVVMGLMCMGFYPNVCFHKEKRKVLTTESKAALIHKTSVNCSSYAQTFVYPFFVFGEKIRTRAVSCKQMSMVTPIHLLLFGSRKVELVSRTLYLFDFSIRIEGITKPIHQLQLTIILVVKYINIFLQVTNLVRLDNWIILDMDPVVASQIVALRPALESLIIRAAQSPEEFFDMSPLDKKVIDVIKELCKLHAGSFGIDKSVETRRPMQQKRPDYDFYQRGPPTKYPRFNNPHMNRGGWSNRRGYGSGRFNSRPSGFRGASAFNYSNNYY